MSILAWIALATAAAVAGFLLGVAFGRGFWRSYDHIRTRR